MKFASHGQFLTVAAAASMKRDGLLVPDRYETLSREFLTVGSDETRGNYDGAFLAPETFSMELLKRSFNFAQVAGRCRKVPVSGQSIKLPIIRETSRADGSRQGGTVAYWVAETNTITSSQPKFGQLQLTPKFLCVLIPCTEQLAMDAPALEETLFSVGSEEIAVALDDRIVNGGGIGTPQGILNATATISVTKESGQAAATILPDNITSMVKRLWPYSYDNAVWFASPSALNHILANPSSFPLRFADPSAPVGTPRVSLAGFPLIVLEQCKTLGTVGDLILCDPTQYAIGDRGAPEMVRSIHVRYVYHESLFKIFYRVDGAPTWSTAVNARNESFTQSPFIVLETRS